jgi:hypothetical protein
MNGAMDHRRPEESPFAGTDIDLFFYGMSEAEADRKVCVA